MGIKDWIALRKGSQLLTYMLDPETILVARKYRSSAIKPAWILGKWKQAVISASTRYIIFNG